MFRLTSRLLQADTVVSDRQSGRTSRPFGLKKNSARPDNGDRGFPGRIDSPRALQRGDGIPVGQVEDAQRHQQPVAAAADRRVAHPLRANSTYMLSAGDDFVYMYVGDAIQAIIRFNPTGRCCRCRKVRSRATCSACYHQAARTLVPSFVRFSSARNSRQIWQGLVLPIKLAPGTVLLVCYTELISHQSEVCEHLFQTSREAMLIASPIANEMGEVTDGWVVMMNDAARDLLDFRDSTGNLRLKQLQRLQGLELRFKLHPPAAIGTVMRLAGARTSRPRSSASPMCSRCGWTRGVLAARVTPGSTRLSWRRRNLCSLNVLASGTFPGYVTARNEGGMVQRVSTVAFEGIEARAVDVQVQVAPGLPRFNLVGLADKAVSEARERVRSALTASGLALPARRITVNLAPGRPAEGRQPLRSADCARPDGRHRRDPAGCAGRLHRARRARPRRLDCAGRGRAAGGDRRQRPRRRIDLPRRLRLRGRLGQPRHSDRRRFLADPARQSFQGHAGAVAAKAAGARGRGNVARPARHQGPGERQARARNRRRRRPSPPDDRQPRRGQIDAGGAAAVDPAAAVAAGAARNLDDRLGRGRARRRRTDQRAARSAHRIIRPAWPRSPAAASAQSPARYRSRTTACCFSTNCRSSSRG